MNRDDIVAALTDAAIAAELLDLVAAKTGNGRYRRAAGMLRGARGGRPTVDDSENIARIKDMLSSGTATSAQQAARFVARTLVGEHTTAAAELRIARKYRQAA